MVVRRIEEAINRAEKLMAEEGSYEEVLAALDACAQQPGAEDLMASIHGVRLTAMAFYRRSDDELEQELERYLALSVPLVDRAWQVISACAESSRLATLYLPPLIAELEAAEADSCDELISNAANCARQVCARLGGSD